jgi:hypothetical protein
MQQFYTAQVAQNAAIIWASSSFQKKKIIKKIKKSQ